MPPGRPRTCDCGSCATCKSRAESARKRASWSPEEHAKQKVRMRMNYALKMGRLQRGPCEVCGLEHDSSHPALFVEGHHDDYDKPLDVRWLCRKHHAEHHKNEKRNAA